MTTDLARTIDDAWENRDALSSATKGPAREAVAEALALLDAGRVRVAEKIPGRMGRASMAEEGRAAVVPPATTWRRSPAVPAARIGGTRSRPNSRAGAKRISVTPAFAPCRARSCAIRRFIAKGVVLMPSFVNVGAYVGENTMVDTWATVGSCAQIGRQCHISGGAGIGGVLEPLQAAPVIVEDNCFVGARAEVAEGVIVGEGSVLSMGVFLGQSTKIVDRATGEILYGRVPPYSVVVPGTLPQGADRPSLYCAVIVKRVDERTRAKTSINELLRD